MSQTKKDVLPREIVYIGNQPAAAKALLAAPAFALKFWIFEKRCEEGLAPVAVSLGLPYRAVANAGELKEALADAGGIRLCLMHGFGIIVPEETTKEYRIFNIHSGSLDRNRGRNPVEWAILLGWQEDEISLHEIDGSIDGGILVDAEKVTIGQEDAPSDLRRRYRERFPALFAALAEYLAGKRKGIAVPKGIYRPRIAEADYTIDPSCDDLATVRNKIRSQADYNGAILIVNGEKKQIHSLAECHEAGFFPTEKRH